MIANVFLQDRVSMHIQEQFLSWEFEVNIQEQNTTEREKIKDRRSLIECYDCGQVYRLVCNVCEKKESWNNKNNNKRQSICSFTDNIYLKTW